MAKKKFIINNNFPAIYDDVELNEYVVNVSSKGGQYVDTYLQDQTSPAFAYYFKSLLGYATLSTNAVIDLNTIELNTGHGVQNGEYISLIDGVHSLQAKVVGVNVNIITLDQPLDYAFSTSSEVRRTIINMNVNGSVTKQIFNIKPSKCMHWHINQISLSITDNTEMDSGKFGGVAALTYGIVIRRKNGEYFNLLSAKTNSELDLKGFVIKYDTKAPSGVYGLTSTKNFNSQLGAGCTIDIKGCDDDELEIIIQDDLTGLLSFTGVAIGHYVMD